MRGHTIRPRSSWFNDADDGMAEGGMDEVEEEEEKEEEWSRRGRVGRRRRRRRGGMIMIPVIRRRERCEYGCGKSG